MRKLLTLLLIILTVGLKAQEDYYFVPDELLPERKEVKLRGENICLNARIDIDSSAVEFKSTLEKMYANVYDLYADIGIYINFDIVYNDVSRWGNTKSGSDVYLRRYMQNRTETIDGELYDIYQLITANATGGGVSFYKGLKADTLTQPNGLLVNYRVSVCPVTSDNYTQKCIAHEMGHTLGSLHTHACMWNGNFTALDGCWSPEPGWEYKDSLVIYECEKPEFPSEGSIMSYCHYWKMWDFKFRQQVADTIYNYVASVVDECRSTGIDDVLDQEVSVFPNPATDHFVITPEPDEVSFYSIDGKYMGKQLKGLPVGMYIIAIKYRDRVIFKRIVKQ